MKILLRKCWQSVLAVGALIAAGSTDADAQGQYYWGQSDMPYIEYRGFSLGTNFGLADMWGDVGTKSPVDHYINKEYWKEPHFMGGLFLRYTHVPGLSVRLGGNYGKVFATDEWNKEKALKAESIQDDYYQRYVRNQIVRTNIWEANLIFEIAPLRLFSNWEFSRAALRNFQPYILLGGGYFRYNPTGLYKDFVNDIERWHDLRPLRTEGQGYNLPGMPDYYGMTSYAVIAGLGVKWDVGRSYGLGLEFQLRHTFTDYLDDVSGKYIDKIYHDIANVEKPGQSQFIYDMMDKSYEILPGYKHQPGEYRGDPNNKDMFSTISLVFYWKIDARAIAWWNDFR